MEFKIYLGFGSDNSCTSGFEQIIKYRYYLLNVSNINQKQLMEQQSLSSVSIKAKMIIKGWNSLILSLHSL